MSYFFFNTKQTLFLISNLFFFLFSIFFLFLNSINPIFEYKEAKRSSDIYFSVTFLEVVLDQNMPIFGWISGKYVGYPAHP